MGESTRISWTDSTWNCWQGCRKVSPGCKHCYAETLVQNRMGRDFRDIRRSAPTTFNAPLKWKSGRRIFTCSISDFFIEEADVWRDEAWEIIRQTPQHTYQILTKRPERIRESLPKTCFTCGITTDYIDGEHSHKPAFWPWPNVWLGTSVESQQYLGPRVTSLVSVPAAVHFLSCEPLLGPLTFRFEANGFFFDMLNHIEWVIVGGESGPNFRPMNLDWAKGIQDQCLEADVPFFYKQGSGIRSEMDPILDGREWREMPELYAATLNRSASRE